MILSDLQTEFQARGFDYLNSTRQNYFLNRAYEEICSASPWPFLETTSSGASPLSVTDLREVLSVADSTNASPLFGVSREDLIANIATNLATTGTPVYWYLSDATTVAVYPATSVTLSVRYLKVPTELSVASDTPVIPTRYQLLIIQGACIRAYEDSDNAELASSLRDTYQNELDAMAHDLLGRNYSRRTEVEA